MTPYKTTNYESMEIDELRRHFNRLAEKYGWKTIPKGKWRSGKPKLIQQIKDLEDLIKAKMIKPMVKGEANDDARL